MLVTCPECGARYELEGALIPPTGRSVQCSSCEAVWTEAPADAARSAPAAEERDASYQPPRRTVAEPEGQMPPPPPLADEIRAILREEAEHEARIRRERGLVHLGPGPDSRTAAAQAPAATQRTAGPPPDPDAINQTLRAASMRPATESGDDAVGGGGFMAGLVLGLGLVGLAALTYVGAPRIAETVPAAASALDTYVASVDTARATLDRAVTRAAAALSDLTGG